MRAVDPRPGQTLLEIGPGRGALTEHRSLIVRSLARAVDGIGAIFANPRLLAYHHGVNHVATVIHHGEVVE